MTKPTLQNRRNFKTYLRYYKNKFTNVIQDITLNDINGILSQKSAGISSTTPVKLIIFDNYDTIDVTSLRNNSNYIYLPGLPQDEFTLKVNNINHNFSFTNTDDGGLIHNGTTYQLNNTISLPGIGITIKGLGGALLALSQGLSIPEYTIGVSTNTVSEGGSLSFTVQTVNVGSGTTLYYQIIPTSGIGTFWGSEISESDFSDNSLTGSFNIVSIGATTGIATITKTLVNDVNTVEGNETFTFNVLTGSASSITGTIVSTSSTITVIDKDPPIVNIGVSTTTVIEGGSVSFVVNTTNVNAGTTLYYSTSGTASAADFSSNSLFGSFSIVGIGSTTGIATITRTIANDVISEGSETFNLVIRTGSTSGTAVTTSETVTIQNLPFTVDVGVSTTFIAEPKVGIATTSIVTFTITTTGISSGTTLTGRIVGVAGTMRFGSVVGDFNLQSNNITINNNSATLSLPTNRDGRTEGLEQFKLEIRNNLGTVIGSSTTITIFDTSFVGSKKTNKTFGPIRVNRDNGNSNQVSDWYTICGLDKLPDGSKVALFIDNSGSMTESTVAASKALLLSKLAERNMDVIVVTNPNEDWVTPFDTILDD